MATPGNMGKCERCGDKKEAATELNGHLFCMWCFDDICKELARTIRKAYRAAGREEG